MKLLARIVGVIGSAIAAIIVVGILLTVLEANESNTLVEWFTDAAHWLAGPFRELFSLDDKDLQIAINWGLAAVVYLALSRVIASLLLRASVRTKAK